MKKLVAVALMVALVLSLSVTAFALKSPQAEGVHKIHTVDGSTGKVVSVVVNKGESIHYSADEELPEQPGTQPDDQPGTQPDDQPGTQPDDKPDDKPGKVFTGWKIYVFATREEAVYGEHFTLGEGQSLSDREIDVYPLVDLIVLKCYDGKEPEFQIGQNGEVTSPQTGDTVAVCLAGIMLVSLVGMLAVSKKRFA